MTFYEVATTDKETFVTDEKRLLTVEDCANRLGVARATLYPKVMAGELRSVRIGRRRLVAIEDLDAYVDAPRRHADRQSGATA